MGDSCIPKPVIANIKKFAQSLNELEKSIAKLIKITREQKEKMTHLEKAKLDLTIVSLVNSLYFLHSTTLGKNPQDEDAVGVEFRRWKEVKDRLQQLEDAHLRPQIDKSAAKSFVRNALFDVDDYNRLKDKLNDAGVDFGEEDPEYEEDEEEYDAMGRPDDDY
ncbi:unnamed protein product [Bursaphelenchus xylophilus]|uniref:Nuclear nucleic acid-binding protein C1D n=1 Tax=Bursaphelenchus xylophilus TaxID=6326 RepID=A0A1I7RSG3_BURXY|nr:unnamed protein product [Bursaphelenchus xylophilus]CAG9122971.1 unnamed protein product [Bursaphelenchus xylophilus]